MMIDLRNVYRPQDVADAGITYQCIGRVMDDHRPRPYLRAVS